VGGLKRTWNGLKLKEALRTYPFCLAVKAESRAAKTMDGSGFAFGTLGTG